MSAFTDLDEEADATERALKAQMGTWRRRAEAAEAERDRLRDRVAELEAAHRWIPVTERLPEEREEGTDVAAWRAGTFQAAVYHEGVWLNFFEGGILEGVTHWKPVLPIDPPR